MIHTKEAIILAGGRGTRLGSLTDNTPKPLLEVGGKPFLLYLINYLTAHGVNHIVLSTGYKAEAFKSLLAMNLKGVELILCEEASPLGTGGGLRLAAEHIKGERFFALNGDTYFPILLAELEHVHLENKAKITLALKHLENFHRYGTVTVINNRVTAFTEKKASAGGLINGGIYLLQKSLLLSHEKNTPFSFEQEILEKNTKESSIFSKRFPNYFIDMGVPEDFEKAQIDCKNW